MGNLCSSGCNCKASDKKATAKKTADAAASSSSSSAHHEDDGSGGEPRAAQPGAAAYHQSSLYGHAPILGYSTMGLGGTSMGASVAVGMGMGGW